MASFVARSLYLCGRSALLPSRSILAILCSSPSSSSPIQSHQCRLFASKRGRRRFVEAVQVKDTKTSKKVVEFYKDMTAKELATALGESFDDVVDVLVNLEKENLEAAAAGLPLDKEWTARAISAFNCKPRLAIRAAKAKENHDDLIPQAEAAASDCSPRAPVVTIMGHVDHGKTTLLDALRDSRIVDGEFGGITQHIGAFSVMLGGSSRRVTFLDTPGHAAFAGMRERGARVTDVVVLVVAADDGVKEQTVQSIKFAREAGVPIVVAVNKCDKPGADPARAKRSLLEHDIVVEDLGGDVQCVEISALYGRNLPALQDALLAQADLLNLRAPLDGFMEGHVIESSVTHGLGKVCTVLISRGQLRKGRILVAGTAWTRVRTMTDDTGREIAEAGPSSPVRISGWKDTLPSPGDIVLEAKDTSRAQKAIAFRERKAMEEKAERDWEATAEARDAARGQYLERRQRMLDSGVRYGSTLRRIAHREKRLQKDEESGQPRLRIILRADVEGTLEAILDVLSSYASDKCDMQLVDFGVGAPTDKDVELAENSGASIYTFNVASTTAVRAAAEKAAVPVKPFNVVYRLVETLKNDLSATLPPVTEMHLVGQGHVLKEFLISDRARKRQPIAGILVDWGDFQKNCIFRFSRGNEVYYEGRIESMKSGLEVVANAKTNTEVGLALDDKNIRFKEDDSVEVLEKRDAAQVIDWHPPGF